MPAAFVRIRTPNHFRKSLPRLSAKRHNEGWCPPDS